MPIFHLVRYFRRIRRKKSAGITLALSLLATSIVGHALCLVLFDGISLWDAIWCGVISVTTIGYGDVYAESVGARLGAMFFVVVMGLGAFTILLGMAIDAITEFAIREERGMGKAYAKNHILIVNFPSAARVLQLIKELHGDPHHQGREIVIVADNIEALPFQEKGVTFINGPVLEEETYHRANASEAEMVILLATSYSDSNSDAIVASAAAVVDRIKTELHLVAECLNPKHEMLFESVNCDAIVHSMTITGNLLAQEAQDPGIAQMVEVLTSNVKGTTLFSTEVGKAAEISYSKLAAKLLDRDVNLIAVNRGEESLTSFTNQSAKPGDRLIYAAAARLSWAKILEKFSS